MVVVFWFLLLVLLLGAAFISGRISRTYPVLASGSPVQIHGISRPVSEWAGVFVPKMLLRKENPSPPLLWIFYEVVDNQKEDVTFVYYFVWEDEIHPNPVYHWTYRLFRAAYYGSPVRDIEFLQIKVNRASGDVVEALFETSPGTDYFVTLSKHIVARVAQVEKGQYNLRLSERNGKIIEEKPDVMVCFQETHLLVEAATWNHLTRLAHCDDLEQLADFNVPLKELTDQDYRDFKFARKSQGDFKTQENSASLLLGGSAFVLLMGPVIVGVTALKLLRWRKRA
jgi:hypothetical protein